MCSYGRFTEPGLPARCKTIHYRMTSDPAARVAHYGALWWSRVPAPFSLLHPRALWLGGPAARSQNERSVGGLAKRRRNRDDDVESSTNEEKIICCEIKIKRDYGRSHRHTHTNRDRLSRCWFFYDGRNKLLEIYKFQTFAKIWLHRVQIELGKMKK